MRLRQRLRRSLMGLMVFVALLAVLMALLRDRSQSALYRPWIGLFASGDPSNAPGGRRGGGLAPSFGNYGARGRRGARVADRRVG